MVDTEKQVEDTKALLSQAGNEHPDIKCGCGAPAIGAIHPDGEPWRYVCAECMAKRMYGQG